MASKSTKTIGTRLNQADILELENTAISLNISVSDLLRERNRRARDLDSVVLSIQNIVGDLEDSLADQIESTNQMVKHVYDYICRVEVKKKTQGAQ